MSEISSEPKWEVVPILGGFVLNRMQDGRKVQNGPAFLVPPAATEAEVKVEAEKEAARRNAGRPA